ncbi:MAG: S-adenosylmethionine decarboxylase [Candidatus Omnitrophota bacterium]
MDKTDNKLKQHTPFGYELLLDLYNCKLGACDDLALCYKFLDEIVGHLGMEKQAPPSIFFTDATRFPDKAGLSGWAPLVESSIVIHTLSPKNYISIDVYCCKEFDTAKAKRFARKFFEPERMDERFLERGIDYHTFKKSKKQQNYSCITK